MNDEWLNPLKIHNSSFIISKAKEGLMATADVESIADDDKAPAEAKREPEVNKLFRMVMKHEGSDLHMKVGLPPMMRLRGIIRQMQMDPLSTEDMERLLYPIMTERQRRILDE